MCVLLIVSVDLLSIVVVTVCWQRDTRVAVLGAAGGIGQPLALLLKQNARITELALYDIVNTPGVAADLSHIATRAKVTAHTGEGELREAVQGSDVVVIPAGVPRKPGMSDNS